MKNFKRFFDKKFAFTLAELLVALAIIAILTALAATTMNPGKKAIKYLYMNAYTALDKAFYNGMQLGHNPFIDPEPDPDEEVQPEHSDVRDTGTEILCRALTSYINTNDNVKNENQDYSASCSATKLTSIRANDFSDDNVQFIANNGMKFYITKRLDDGNEENPFYFYVVFVDINGERQPNSFEYGDNDREPDIYAFALLNTGRVVILGVPEYDTDVLTARFIFYSGDGDGFYSRPSVAYYQAKGAAWGYYSDPEKDVLSFEQDDSNTMNDYVRDLITRIDADSRIVADFPNLRDLEPLALADDEEHNCSSENFQSCYVFLDAYRQF